MSFYVYLCYFRELGKGLMLTVFIDGLRVQNKRYALNHVRKLDKPHQFKQRLNVSDLAMITPENLRSWIQSVIKPRTKLGLCIIHSTCIIDRRKVSAERHQLTIKGISQKKH